MKSNISFLAAGLCSGALFLTAHAQGTAGSSSSSGTPATGSSTGAVGTAASSPAATTAPAPGTTATGLPTATTTAPTSAAVTTSSTEITQVSTPPADPTLGTATTKPLGTMSGSSAAGNVTPSLNTPAVPVTPGRRGTDPIGAQRMTELPESRVTDPLAPNTAALPSTVVSSAPPQPIVEQVPPSTNANEVWVAGHYTFTSGSWTWVNGRWAMPPTPGSAWMEGRYDPATRRWTEGQWQANARAAGAATRVTPGTTR